MGRRLPPDGPVEAPEWLRQPRVRREWIMDAQVAEDVALANRAIQDLFEENEEED